MSFEWQNGASLWINDCGRSSLYIIVAGGPFGDLFFVLEGCSTVQKGPYSVESHLEIEKIERSKILKREPLFSEEKKPENHFFASKSFARYIMVEGVRFCVRNCQF